MAVGSQPFGAKAPLRTVDWNHRAQQTHLQPATQPALRVNPATGAAMGFPVRRSRLFPRQVSDVGAFLFVCVMIPSTFVYEVHLVLPVLYAEGPARFYLHGALGFFLLFNIVGNFVGLWLTDTSTRHVFLPTSCPLCSGWRLRRRVRRSNLSHSQHPSSSAPPARPMLRPDLPSPPWTCIFG